MRITSVYPMRTFKLIMEFEHREYRIMDIRAFLSQDSGLLIEIREDLNMFLTAKVDSLAGTVCWDNGVDFDPKILYESSKDIDELFG